MKGKTNNGFKCGKLLNKNHQGKSYARTRLARYRMEGGVGTFFVEGSFLHI
jgi:hypothetical protein